jgi:hypothetical protein
VARGPARLRLVVRHRPPPRGALEPIFDSGGAYRVYRRGAAHVIALHADSSTEPYEVAVIDFAAGRGTLHVTAAGGPDGLPFEHPLGELLFSWLLAERDGVVVHACGAHRDGRGLLLAGGSGAGKSTLAALFAADPANGVLSDDRVAVELTPQGVRNSGTPWSGTAGLARPDPTSAAAVVFLHHARRNSLVSLAPERAASRLLALTVIPYWDPDAAKRAVATGLAVVRRLPAYDFGFVPTPRAVAHLQQRIPGAPTDGHRPRRGSR